MNEEVIISKCINVLVHKDSCKRSERKRYKERYKERKKERKNAREIYIEREEKEKEGWLVG